MNQRAWQWLVFWVSLCSCLMAACHAAQAFELKMRSVEQSTDEQPLAFRGIAVDPRGGVWVGGSKASLFKSVDAGQTWLELKPDVPATSDFRDIEPTTAGVLAMSAGVGNDSRIVLTQDGGKTWRCVLENPDAKGFFNGMAFTESGFGALVGDPIDEQLTVFVTTDGGRNWKRVPGPKVASDEYGFAASGSGIVVDASQGIGIVTGGSQSRFYYRPAKAEEWTGQPLGLRHGTKSAGAFSCVFSKAIGIAVGGDYLKPDLAAGNVAVTRNHGKSWTVPQVSMPHKSCVLTLGGERFVTCGRTGIAITRNGGLTWKQLTTESFYTMTRDSRIDGNQKITEVWLAGANGRVAILALPTAD